MTPEEENAILHSAPKGTFALLIAYAAIFMAGWLFMFFYLFLAHGTVN